MLIFAWVVLALSITSLINLIGDFLKKLFKEFSEALFCLEKIFPVALWISGCLWYIFDFAVLPYSLIIGIALGATVRPFLTQLAVHVFLARHGAFWLMFYIEDFTLYMASIFFVLAAAQRVWPHLITF